MIDTSVFKSTEHFSGAKGLVYIGEKAVFIRRDTNTKNFPLHVDLPGGGRENNESPFETLKRELMEELGLTIHPDSVVFAKKYPSVLDVTKKSYFIVIKSENFDVADIVFGDEGTEFLLIFPEEYITLPDGVSGQQERVRDYLNLIH